MYNICLYILQLIIALRLYLNATLCSQHTRNWMEILQKLNTFQPTKGEETAEGAQQEGTYDL